MRRRYILGGSVLLAGATAFLAVGWWWREPAYQGKTLRRWLQELQAPSPVARHAAQEALRHIGSNAVPTIKVLLHAEDTSFKTNLVTLLQCQSWVRFSFVPARSRRIQAALGCVELGPVAQPALPDLFEFSKDTAFCFNLAQSALSRMGQGAVPALARELSNTNYQTRQLAVGALAHMGPAAEAAAPALLRCLGDDYASVRTDAVRALGRIGVASPAVVKALVRAFSRDYSASVTVATESELVGFGQQAVPALRELLGDSDESVRQVAKRILKQIEAAAQRKG
jgi:hypothetical protein